MIAILAMFIPVSVFVLQAWVAVGLDLPQVQMLYIGFLSAYFPAFLLALLAARRQRQSYVWDSRFNIYIKAFLVTKAVIVFYFGLVFLYYFAGNGFAYVRHYMTSVNIQASPFYFAPFMYLDAYIIYPLNYLVLLSLFIQKKWRYFNLLLLAIFMHTVVFYASRMLIYNALMLTFFGALHLRRPLRKIFSTVLGFAIVGLTLSLVIAFTRDTSMSFDGTESISYSLVNGALNYHLIPPLILNSIIEKSTLFSSGYGYGLASFGFLLDPFISLLPVEDPKSLMASKMLSAEAQSFIFSYDDHIYNAFTTFLYPAVYDFGLAGPILYGAFFGAGVGYGFGRRDGVGFVIFCIFAYFVFFNAFTFFITGDWLWALVLAGLCFKPARSWNRHLNFTQTRQGPGRDRHTGAAAACDGHPNRGT
jgi:oligosaccharide repeat unit polymerase